MSVQMRMPEEKCAELLDDENTAEVIREVSRSIIQNRAPKLYQEFVNRHSILSRFCQNMAISIVVFSLSIALLLPLFGAEWWDTLVGKTRGSCYAVVIAVLAIVVLVLSILRLQEMSLKLRRFMARHTFEIWYAESLGLLNDEKAVPNNTTPKESA